VITALAIDQNFRGNKILKVKDSFKRASVDILSCATYSEHYGISLFDESILYVK
jgi:hypothetical protein